MKSLPLRALLLLALGLVNGAAYAADLDQAKQDGLVGERADGLLGLVEESAASDVVALVKDVNQRRELEYARIAAANGLTVEEVRALAGKKTVAKTRVGDWILLNGAWQRKPSE